MTFIQQDNPTAYLLLGGLGQEPGVVLHNKSPVPSPAYLLLGGLGQQPGVVLGGDLEGLLGVLVQVLDEGQVAPDRQPDLVLDRVQHLHIQHLILRQGDTTTHQYSYIRSTLHSNCTDNTHISSKYVLFQHYK